MDSTAAELQNELKQQLQEQLESLASINEALQAGHDEELFAVKQQLEEAIPALQQSIEEIRQHVQLEDAAAAADHQQGSPQDQQAITAAEPPSWLSPGAECRYCCAASAEEQYLVAKVSAVAG